MSREGNQHPSTLCSVFVAADAETRLEHIRRWLQEAPSDEEALLIAPTRGAADELLRRLPEGQNGSFGIHRLTPLQLASELATPALARQGLAPVTSLGSEALAARCLGLRQEAEELEYFGPVAGSPGLPRALRRTLRELRLDEVSPAELEAVGAPGRDLARLLTTYEQELRKWSLVDEADLLRFAREAARSKPTHRLLARPLVLLDLSLRHRAESRLFSAVISRAPRLVATGIAGDGAGRRALEELCGVAAQDHVDNAATEDGEAPTRLDLLRRRIFLPDLEGPPQPPPESDASVILVSAPGEGRECAEIARQILALAREGLPFDQVAVLLRDPETYFPLLEEAFARSGIPAYFTRGTARPHPAGRALLALLACAGEGLSASRFAEYLSLGQVPSLDEAGQPPMMEVPWVAPVGDQLVFKSLLPASAEETAKDSEEEEEETDQDPVIAGTLRTPRRWEKLLVDAAVLGGEDRWRRRLDGLDAELRLRLRHLESDDHSRQQQLFTQLAQLSRLKSFALPVIAELAALPGEGDDGTAEAATWGDWLHALEALCGRVLRQPERVLEVLAELRPMEQVGPVGLEEVRRVLEERLIFLRAEPPQRRYARVFVAKVDEARGRSFDTVFLPGLAEGIFPRRASEDPLLLDELRRRLDAPLDTQADRVDQERLLLRIAAGAASRRLRVSYPNLDVLQGRARVPSFYALDLLRAAEGRLPDLYDLEKRAAAGSDSILGWPAPREAENAIDDAEFDLAVLEPLLRGPAEAARSRGRYLLETNELLARSLRVRYQKWRPRLSSADGLYKRDEATVAALAEHQLRRRSYSPTALQSFAACPYRFLLSAVHRLRPRDKAVRLERLDPLTRGSLFHQVQFELFQRLEQQQLLPMQEDDLAVLLDFADRQLDDVAARYQEDLSPAIPRVWALEIESLRTDLRGWLRAVVAAAEPWRPRHFEFTFGLPPDPLSQGTTEVPRHEAVVLDGKRLRGAIDLVEIDEARKVIRVTDHKTGRPPRERQLVIGGGEILQPLLYALAAEVHLGQPVESGRLFYCTRRGQYETREVPLTPENRQYVSLVLDVIDRSLSDGALPAAPREGACRLCDFRSVCGPNEELRIQRKRRGTPQAFVRLDTLRRSP